MSKELGRQFIPLNISVLVVSDSRTEATDTSGRYLVSALNQAGHSLHEKAFVADDKYAIRARVSVWIADPVVHVILLTGGTGFAKRDVTPDAIAPLFDVTIDGFAITFQQVSAASIGSSAVQSRSCAGVANNTAIFCLPGSRGACRDAWEHILSQQLDYNHSPCNFVMTLLHDAVPSA